ncbi:MAG TPA: hypothetical protein VEJ18_20325 [Planctomycetota bacterium]|nr:hypothetical protein [Planctomycetota bacterium]
MTALALALLLAASQDAAVVLRLAEGATAESFPAVELPSGETGVVLGGLAPSKAWPDLLAAGGWTVCFETSDRPWVARELGGRRIAFVPDGPPEAVAIARDDAKGDLAVLVVPGDRARAVETIRAVPGFALALASGRGGADPEPLKIGETWIVQGPGPGAWARVELRLESVRLASVASSFAAPEGRPSAIVEDARRRHGLPTSDPVAVLLERVKPEAGPPAAPALEATTRSCRWRILGAAERATYGPRAAAPGRRFLVLDAEVENVIPMTLVKSHEVPTEVRIQPLSDHLYLVVGGARAARLPKDADAWPGHLPVKTFSIERLGARARGNLVFEVPENAPSLELRLYDYAHGHFVLPLRSAGPPKPAPMPPLSSNEALEAGIFDVRTSAAPDGRERVTVEFRARSRLETEADASAFDPKASPKAKIKVGTVADWTDAAGHLTLVVDGDRAVGPETAFEDPRFLPDVLTGLVATFLVPGKRTSLELRAEFPNARLPDGRVIRPRPLVFLLEGARPGAAAEAPLIAAIDDGPFRVEIAGQAVVPAEKGTSRLTLDVAVRNAAAMPETFQVAEQLRYATESGAQVEPDPATFAGTPKLLKIPPNDRRRFPVVFLIPATDTRPRLAYRGVTKAEIVALKPLAAPAPTACPACKAAVEPAEKFCSGCGAKLKP